MKIDLLLQNLKLIILINVTVFEKSEGGGCKEKGGTLCFNTNIFKCFSPL